MIKFIDEIPLENYLWYLIMKRGFNKDLTIEYTKDIYNIDLTNELNDYSFLYRVNIFNEFMKNNPRNKEDDGTRGYFQSYGKKYFNKFNEYLHGKHDQEDMFNPFVKKCVVHHIHPLTISRNNDLKNLVYLSDFHHKILHKNPLENNRECCFKALDYLAHLYSSLEYLIDQYKLNQFKDNLPVAGKIFKVAIETEMDSFYKRMVKRYEVTA